MSGSTAKLSYRSRSNAVAVVGIADTVADGIVLAGRRRRVVVRRSHAFETQPVRDGHTPQLDGRPAFARHKRDASPSVSPPSHHRRPKSAQPEQRAVAVERILAQVDEVEPTGVNQETPIDRSDVVVGDVEVSERRQVGDIRWYVGELVAVEGDLAQGGYQQSPRLDEREAVVAEVERLDATSVSEDVVVDPLDRTLVQTKDSEIDETVEYLYSVPSRYKK